MPRTLSYAQEHTVLTDNFNAPVAVPVNWNSRSALFKYLKSEALHLVVFPDFLEHKDQLLAQIVPQPLHAQLKVGYKFQLGGANPGNRLHAGGTSCR
jgi:hypothetical protein